MVRFRITDQARANRKRGDSVGRVRYLKGERMMMLRLTH